MLDWHVFLFDDASSSKSKKEGLLLKKKYGRRVTIIFSPRHVGIIKGLNRLVEALPAGISIPISADLRFCNSLLPWRMIYAFLIFKVDFFFYKARHVDSSTGVRVGTTGWARKRGLQLGNQKKRTLSPEKHGLPGTPWLSGRIALSSTVMTRGWALCVTRT